MPTRTRLRRTTTCVVVVTALALIAACGSSSKPRTGRVGGGGVAKNLGVGVTAGTIKIGVVAPDFQCFKQFVDSIRVEQDKVWKAYVDDVNSRGGVLGRKLVMDFKLFCPVPGIGVQAAVMCTQFTEDDKVFAIMGTLVDFSGDTHQCVTAQHKTILMTFLVNQANIDKAPPGLLIAPDIAKERRVNVILTLMKREHTLKGKKVGVLGETVTKNTVDSTIVPGLRGLGVQLGTTAILNITGADTTAAQQQLDSFIERWKSERTNAIFASGEQVSSKQFIAKVRQQMPNVVLIADNSGVNGYGQDFVQEKVKPNPYEGIISADGDTGREHDKLPVWKYCADIYQKAFHKPAPDADAIVPGPEGKTLDTYGLIEDACTLVTMFHDIAVKAGKNLSNTTWTDAVDHYGKIRDMDTNYASLHKGKYDADDTFRLVAFDSSIGPKGDWRQVTPVEDVGSKS